MPAGIVSTVTSSCSSCCACAAKVAVTIAATTVKRPAAAAVKFGAGLSITGKPSSLRLNILANPKSPRSIFITIRIQSSVHHMRVIVAWKLRREPWPEINPQGRTMPPCSS
ncbi:MAG: hypothetical protein E5X49_29325 [Mesorhizobium sp.]|uniref:hypothetical protein n=1 Tax=Mesorhizobium sp. TaxID=1871066 RepID=UPI00120E269D|nr:hypothetical protein [Mesorhizobium sp.]TIQ39103.1 MAG: hypothetical protein E5X49_29325 [Mesorhizobium sp.]